ncbi:hypothetical protein I4R72_002460 [Salmonella enterica]|nr:hypothetical protein [Salmonella enterica]
MNNYTKQKNENKKADSPAKELIIQILKEQKAIDESIKQADEDRTHGARTTKKRFTL